MLSSPDAGSVASHVKSPARSELPSPLIANSNWECELAQPLEVGSVTRSVATQVDPSRSYTSM